MSLIDQLAALPPECQRVAGTALLQFRRAHAPDAAAAGAVTHVLLHGIGSASASWLAQLQSARQTPTPPRHVLAWDAPGYGTSTALAMQAPTAADYAHRLWEWLDALDVRQPVTLVGHSLGALMAAAAALQAPARVRRLVLLSPAPGYARAPAAVRAAKLAERLDKLATLGPAGIARQRAAAMLSPDASAEQLAFIEQVMAQIDPHGYAQASRMLAGGDLLADLERLAACPLTIASGEADTITPPQACRALAGQCGVDHVSLGAVGHACSVQAPDAVNRVIGLGGDSA